MFENTVILWIIVAVIMMFIEAGTLGLTTIWFALGAILASITAAANGPVWLQITIFLASSILCLIFLRNWLLSKFNKKREKTNVDNLIGQKAVVTESICNIDAVGKVEINGMEWSARQVDNADEKDGLPKGTIVTVEGIKGVKLIVRKEEE